MSPIELLVTAAASLAAVLASTITGVVRTVDAVRALSLAEEEVRGADALLWLTERPLATHRASAVVSILAAVAVGISVPLGDLGAATAALLVTVVLAPLVARPLVGRRAERTGLLLAAPARLVVRAMTRPVELFDRAEPDGDDTPTGESDEEDRQASDEEDTILDVGERRMILSILELDETATREIMVPRQDVVAVPSDASFAHVVDVALEHGRSRLPVHDPGEPDAMHGVVHARDLLKRMRQEPRVLHGGPEEWADLVREPYLVPDSRRADDLLRDLQAAAVHLAFVVDEYGEIVGIVTIEDVLEEIVGEIVDEHDDERPQIEPLAAGGWRVDAGMHVADLGAELEVDLPAEEWDTVGGLVIGTLGRLPRVGDRVEVDGLALTVTVRRGRRVVEVRVERRVLPAGEDGHDSGVAGHTDGGPAAALR